MYFIILNIYKFCEISFIIYLKKELCCIVNCIEYNLLIVNVPRNTFYFVCMIKWVTVFKYNISNIKV